MEYKKVFVEQLPIPLIFRASRQIVVQLENLVDEILAVAKDDDYLKNADKQAKVKEHEKHIDQLVYELHGLTRNEIKIVEDMQ